MLNKRQMIIQESISQRDNQDIVIRLTFESKEEAQKAYSYLIDNDYSSLLGFRKPYESE
jgi:hypothetical protein